MSCLLTTIVVTGATVRKLNLKKPHLCINSSKLDPKLIRVRETLVLNFGPALQNV